MQFYPFGFLHGDDELPDYYSSYYAEVYLSQRIYFYEESVREVHVRMYVNSNAHLSFVKILQIGDNGIISFNSPYNSHTPASLPLYWYSFIAPYWADVDISRTGEVFYRQSTNSSLLARASREIENELALTQSIEIEHLLIVTWNAVGYYYRGSDKVCNEMAILQCHM